MKVRNFVPTALAGGLIAVFTGCENKNEIAGLYDGYEFAQITRTVMRLADEANRLVNDEAPWKTIGSDLQWDDGAAVIPAVVERDPFHPGSGQFDLRRRYRRRRLHTFRQ